MKKLLIAILCVSVLTPSFAFADEHKSEQKRKNESHKSEQLVQKKEKKEERHSEEREENRRGNNNQATTTPPVQVAKKTNYYLCKSSAGWNVISVNGTQSLNSANSQGDFCMKLPYGLAKKFNITPAPVATTTPDILAPVVSAITAGALTTTGATISWTTNELANGRVYYSTSTPVATTTAMNAGSATLVTAHTFGLTALTPNTTYYYVVKSVDAVGNVTTSSEQSFATPATPDTIAPIISAVANSLVASTTATVAWTTNELATGKLYFGTSTPLTLFASTSSLSLAHSFNLTGLTASTTYNLLLESLDATGNIATTTSTLITTN